MLIAAARVAAPLHGTELMKRDLVARRCAGEPALLVPRPAAAGAVQKLDLHRFRIDVGAQPLRRCGAADGLTGRYQSNELRLFLIGRGMQRYFDLVDRHVTCVVDMKSYFSHTVRLAVDLDPRADASGLAAPFVLGALGLPAVFATQQDEADDELAMNTTENSWRTSPLPV
jgi:hypothetical protein